MIHVEALTLHLNRIAPEAYAVFICIEGGHPVRVLEKCDEHLRKTLISRNAMLFNPTLGWGLNNDGVAVWSQGQIKDPYGVFDIFRRAGLPYGTTWALGIRTRRSIMSALRPDRDFSVEETITAMTLLENLHHDLAKGHSLTSGQVDALTFVASGERHARAASTLGISESGFKARLKSARAKLGARTTVEAVRLARDLDIL